MKTLLTAIAGIALLALAACGDLPPGKIPFSTTAEQGGGDANFNFHRGVGY